MPKKELWIWLSECLNSGSRKIKIVLSHFGTIDAVYAATPEEYEALPHTVNDKDKELLCHKSLVRVQKIMSDCKAKNIRIVTPQDEEYPECLWDIPTPPAVLYVRGESLNVKNSPAIAVVGTRHASKNGREAARKIAREIALGGGVVVTGFARGVDTLATEGAVSAGGKTVAVLGCGTDICYPSENKRLMDAVLKNGTVVSEYPPGTRPTRLSFPLRNRIISGIALGTVVVEAPEKSGALITANFALEQGRDVFAVPAGIFEHASQGSNRLIREGAIAVMSGNDVLSEYIHLFGDKINTDITDTETETTTDTEKTDKRKDEKKEFSFPEGYLDRFEGDDRAVITAIAGDELRADEIAEKSGLKVQKVLALLTLLEIRGHLRQLAGGRFVIKDIEP